MKQSLLDVAIEIAESPNSLSETGDYCELEDESKPLGLVVFRRKNGEPFMWMPRKDYEALNKDSIK